MEGSEMSRIQGKECAAQPRHMTARLGRWSLRALLLVALALPAAAQTRADPETASGLAPKPLATAEAFMVVAAHPLAAGAGAEMLAAGGSAADAAIATLLALNVVEPQSSGIGGGAFALVAWPNAGPEGLTSFDARETAPAAASAEMFLEGGEPLPFLTAIASGDSVGVPGLVRLIEALHARHGKLPWARLFKPAILLAEDGFAVSPRLAESIASAAGRLIEADAGAVFAPGGRPLAAGDRLRQPALARTLRTLAEQGPDAFYEGPIAEAIFRAVARGPRPGAMAPGDLAAYRVVERPAVCHPFADTRVCGMGPPSSGATTVGQMLMLLDRTGATELAADDPRLWHLFAEASRLAYADRAKYLADPDFVDVPVKGLLDPGYMDARARLIPQESASEGEARAGDPPFRQGRLHAPDTARDRPGTTHVSVIDGEGLAVSVTASIETAFGSGRMAEGFLLNNQLTDFSFLPETEDGRPIANAAAPGKRPRSSMAPTIVFREDRPAVLTGSPGGSRIPEYVAQNLLGMLALGLDPAEAAALGHVSQRNSGTVTIEAEAAPAIGEGLRAMGHEVDTAEMSSGVHTIRVLPDGTLEGAADPRREGIAVGN
jgi:gamma-glutamyltranspeptidase/glutathione hydrolase